LPNVGPYIYDVKILALQGSPYIHDISRLRVNVPCAGFPQNSAEEAIPGLSGQKYKVSDSAYDRVELSKVGIGAGQVSGRSTSRRER
jgi:hypothetical protein